MATQPSKNINSTSLDPKCIASTGDSFSKSVLKCHAALDSIAQEHDRYNSSESNLFRGAQFSSDGTTIVTHSEDQSLRTFLLPTSLLKEIEQPHALKAYSSLPSPSPIQSYAIYPAFKLEDPSTTVVLSAAKDLPISLNNVLDYETVHATYPLTHKLTEALISPSSLQWTSSGTHFIAGSKDRISIFDASRTSADPVIFHQTAPGRLGRHLHTARSEGGCRGIVNALSVSRDGVLAAGTLQRQVALYSNEGSGECVTSFSVATQPSDGDTVKGTGITQLAWSPDGTYLLIAERQGDCIQVYDVRNLLKRVSVLNDRKASTTQRLGMDVLHTAGGYEVWAAGTDGYVRMWSHAGAKEGKQESDAAFKAHNGMSSGHFRGEY